MANNQSLTFGFTAFAGARRIASGDLPQVARAAKQELEREPWAEVLIFDDSTGRVIDVDYRGTPDDVVQRLAEARSIGRAEGSEPEFATGGTRGPGRPRLGVVAREVTLLPRHWEWLASQPGGASVALRKLVEHARMANQNSDQRRRSQEAAYRFLSTKAGNEPGFEEAIRALFAGKQARFEECARRWPNDIREYGGELAAAAFDPRMDGAALASPAAPGSLARKAKD